MLIWSYPLSGPQRWQQLRVKIQACKRCIDASWPVQFDLDRAEGAVEPRRYVVGEVDWCSGVLAEVKGFFRRKTKWCGLEHAH
jgi:hypothetical protein